jgi:putative FmdB family regulatory protein
MFGSCPNKGGFPYTGGGFKLPIYEYQCSKGHQYERAEGFDAPTEQMCPKCGGSSRRLISMPAVIFKGSGFYSTDNRKGQVGNNGGSVSRASDDHGQSNAGGDSKAEATTAD